MPLNCAPALVVWRNKKEKKSLLDTSQWTLPDLLPNCQPSPAGCILLNQDLRWRGPEPADSAVRHAGHVGRERGDGAGSGRADGSPGPPNATAVRAGRHVALRCHAHGDPALEGQAGWYL